jgi:thioredoxin reductase (NADPH)
VFYGAARTEALGVRGQQIVLVGGGNSAGQAAMFFSSYAQSVTLLIRGDAIEKSMSQYLIDELRTRANVQIELQSQIVEVRGEHRLEEITVRTAGGQPRTRPADALFIFIGADPETDWLPPTIARDMHGFVCTGRDIFDTAFAAEWTAGRDPFLLETTIPGVFAAGDVRHGSIKRVASAVGEGSMAIAFVHEYLAARRLR